MHHRMTSLSQYSSSTTTHEHSNTLVTLFAPDGGALYQVLSHLFGKDALPDLHTLIHEHADQEGSPLSSAFPEQWSTSSFTIADDSNPFAPQDEMRMELCWYQDQFGYGGVNCQIFLTGPEDFPPLGWAVRAANRHGIALVEQHNPEMVERYLEALPKSAGVEGRLP